MGSTLWEQLFQNSAFNEENQVVERNVQYGPSYHKSLHIWMDINSWKKAQKIYYSKLLTVLPSEEKQHFCFDSMLLYYFNFLHGGYIYVLLMLKREIIKRNRELISLFSSFERNRTRVWMRKTDTVGWQGHRIQGVHFEFCLALRLWTQGRLDLRHLFTSPRACSLRFWIWRFYFLLLTQCCLNLCYLLTCTVWAPFLVALPCVKALHSLTVMGGAATLGRLQLLQGVGMAW